MAQRSEVLRCSGLGFGGDWSRKQIEGTGGSAHLGGSDAQIAGGGCQAAMTEQQLNGAHVGAGFQQMDREGVTHRMRRDGFGNAATSLRLLAHQFHRLPLDMAARNITREEPWLGLRDPPPVAK